MKNKIREYIQNKLGYWFYKTKHLPVGTDVFIDLKNKVEYPLEVIFDVGANIGEFTINFNSEYPKSTIYAFEPFKKTFDFLEKSTRELSNVELFQHAVGDKNEKVEIELNSDDYSPQNSLLNKVTNSLKKTELISVVTIDDFLKEKYIDKIDFLKIDTEGYEEQVLSGATESIKSGKIKIIYLEVGFSKLNLGNTNFLKLYETLENLNYTFFGLYEISQIGISSNLHYGNALFIHNSISSKIENWQLK
ncbi:FkbM family methyltransferase [Brumimicrobium oceani]|uniref:Methyltransferase FkbM domain-containing protein n=1 Tax=Brumimicrobium oceani TaxID=2100725 RepID=A0A2U2XC45_9FLAO|nr:FkbM family methyltransferase [Brumimicrobium oceani]PWH85320.1 hypothetical protein DIT68_10310 [Brumimicrobium oceani]